MSLKDHEPLMPTANGMAVIFYPQLSLDLKQAFFLTLLTLLDRYWCRTLRSGKFPGPL
jgi:hypothetical protein